MTYGTYAYMTRLKDRTMLTKKIKMMVMSKEALQKIEDEKANAEFEKDNF